MKNSKQSLAEVQDGAAVLAWLQKYLGEGRIEAAKEDKYVPRGEYGSTVCMPIKCVLGGSISVQASEFHYATPRENVGPWTEVEIGYPQGLHGVDEILGPGEDPETNETVWGYVPIEKVVMLLLMNGGPVRDEKS